MCFTELQAQLSAIPSVASQWNASVDYAIDLITKYVVIHGELIVQSHLKKSDEGGRTIEDV